MQHGRLVGMLLILPERGDREAKPPAESRSPGNAPRTARPTLPAPETREEAR